MSVCKKKQALLPSDVMLRKGKTPLVCLTAYSTPMALLADAHCDIVLVGDSVGMVVHGLPSTLGVTLDMMILHGQAVRRGLKKALLVIDLPFGSYERGPQAAFETAVRVMRETSCHAVKLEGGRLMAETIRYLVARGVPVMGHVGLVPQSIHVLGGYKVQGRGSDSERILQDAIAVADAGAFAVVLEKIPGALAQRITHRVPIPTIGIGASSACDGQILVMDDMLGLLFSAFQPEFVKRYAELGVAAEAALERYAEDVRTRSFVSNRHTFYDSRANDELTLF